jgi:hypothetical protein
VALRIRDRVGQNQEQLLKWIKNLNPGLHMEHSRVLNKQSELKGQRLILLIDWDSYTTIKRSRHKISTGLSQGTVKVLKDPEAQHQKEATLDTESSKSVSEGEGDEIPTPSDDQSRAVERKEEIPHETKSMHADQGTTLNGTQCDKRGEVKERMETEPSLIGK